MIELLLEAERALAKGRIDQAEYLYRQAAIADPRNSIAVVGLGRVALERDDEAEAWRQARRALEIDPENAAAIRMIEVLEDVWRRSGRAVEPAGNGVVHEEPAFESAARPVPEAVVAPVPEASPEPEPEAVVEPDAETEPEPEPEPQPEPEAERDPEPAPAVVESEAAVAEPEHEADTPVVEPEGEPATAEPEAVAAPDAEREPEPAPIMPDPVPDPSPQRMAAELEPPAEAIGPEPTADAVELEPDEVVEEPIAVESIEVEQVAENRWAPAAEDDAWVLEPEPVAEDPAVMEPATEAPASGWVVEAASLAADRPAEDIRPSHQSTVGNIEITEDQSALDAAVIAAAHAWEAAVAGAAEPETAIEELVDGPPGVGDWPAVDLAEPPLAIPDATPSEPRLPKDWVPSPAPAADTRWIPRPLSQHVVEEQASRTASEPSPEVDAASDTEADQAPVPDDPEAVESDAWPPTNEEGAHTLPGFDRVKHLFGRKRE